MVRFASFLVVFGALFTVVPAVSEDRMIMASGDPFPELSLPAFTSTADRSYLGLVGETDLTPSQIKANLLLVELLNVHCSHCQKQTPSYSELFRLIEADPAARGRVKIFGIAVGNLPQEVTSFRERYPVPFPVIPDPHFTYHRALGASATPFTLYVRQDRTGQPGVIAKTHLGLNPDYRKVLAELKQLLSSKPAELRRQRA